MNFIQLGLEAENWSDAIKLSAKPLLSKGLIMEGYIEAMIDNVNKYGSYIVVDDNIAIPHAKGSNFINESCFSISTFKTPVPIGDHKDVRMFIVLAISDESVKVELITKIMKLIEDEDLVEVILSSDDKECVCEKIINKLDG